VTATRSRARTADDLDRVRALARPRASLAFGALAIWLAVIVVAVVWGEHVVAVGDRLRIHAPPLSGDYRTRFDLSIVLPILVALVTVTVGPVYARRAPWRSVLLVAGGVAVAWAIALGLNDGWSGLTDPLLPGQYLRTVPRVGDPLTFLRGYADNLASYNIHTQGHPPGMVLVLWAMDRIGLGGTVPNLVLVLAGGAASVAATLVAAREVAGEAFARAAAPFLALAPAMIWWSSGDAFFAGVSAWAAALVVLATGRSGRAADRLALAGGLLFGVTAMLSYGLVLVAVIPAVVAIARRQARPLIVATIGAALIAVLFLAAGFSWIAGLEATNARYWAGVASRRPYAYFVFGNLAAFALAVGPAAAVGLAWLRDRRAWLLVGGALVAVALADLSGMSKAEVERIWLPFVPWTLLACGAIATTRVRGATTRVALAAQAVTAILIQTAVRSPW
jgi:hypothetical protein